MRMRKMMMVNDLYSCYLLLSYLVLILLLMLLRPLLLLLLLPLILDENDVD